MKCLLESPNTICDRCTRKSLDCVFEKHRRGRKSTRYRPVPPKTALYGLILNRPKLQHQDSQSPATVAGYLRSPIQEYPPACYPQLGNTHDDRIWTPRTTTQTSSVSKRWNISDSLQPSSLLSKEAQSGQFSLQNVLSIPNLLTTDSVPNNRNVQNLTPGSLDTDDPIFCNFLSYPIALGLFDK